MPDDSRCAELGPVIREPPIEQEVRTIIEARHGTRSRLPTAHLPVREDPTSVHHHTNLPDDGVSNGDAGDRMMAVDRTGGGHHAESARGCGASRLHRDP